MRHDSTYQNSILRETNLNRNAEITTALQLYGPYKFMEKNTKCVLMQDDRFYPSGIRFMIQR